jgi:ferritin-like metal-binding protein YciE
MADAEDRLMQWLRDAHAMEKQAEELLLTQAGRIENYPEMKRRLAEHLGETRDQVRRLEECIERRGGSKSAINDATARLVAFAQSIAGLFAGDEVVKAPSPITRLSTWKSPYRILIAAADQLGDQITARACEDNLLEEEAMATWRAENRVT